MIEMNAKSLAEWICDNFLIDKEIIRSNENVISLKRIINDTFYKYASTRSALVNGVFDPFTLESSTSEFLETLKLKMRAEIIDAILKWSDEKTTEENSST